MRKIKYNSPVALSFALISFIVLILGMLTGGKSTSALFCVYRSSLSHVLTYPRFFLHVLGHSGMEHYMSNMLLFLVVAPPLEEKYGSRTLLIAIAITAFISGLVQFIFFPTTALLGASGVVFMMIVMSSMTRMRDGSIPLTLILVFILYVGSEIYDLITKADNISQLTHIVGGFCGAFIGFHLNRPVHRKR